MNFTLINFPDSFFNTLISPPEYLINIVYIVEQVPVTPPTQGQIWPRGN